MMRSVFVHNRIYFVTCEELSSVGSIKRSDEEMVESVLWGGVRVIQLRDKHSSRKGLLKKAIRLRELTSRYRAVLIINDDPELALEVGADGVHLGQEDFPINDARRLNYRNKNGQQLIIGLSTHNQSEVTNAIDSSADYINLGPIFPTQTKKNNHPPLAKVGENGEHDFTTLKKMIELSCLRIPFTVMGGIKEEHIPPLAELGVKHFAMITALTQHPSPQEQAAHLIRIADHEVRKNRSTILDQEKNSTKFNYRNIV